MRYMQKYPLYADKTIKEMVENQDFEGISRRINEAFYDGFICATVKPNDYKAFTPAEVIVNVFNAISANSEFRKNLRKEK